MTKKLKTLKTVTIFYLSLILISCSSPTAKLEPKMTEFKTQYPSNIQFYQGKNRQMQFAWSGDPKKRPLIFVHGSPGSWAGWVEFLLNKDLQKKFHLIAVDRPGYGGSGSSVTEPSLKKQAEDIIEVMHFNQSGKKAILVGHSYGGAVIAEIAADQPEQIDALIFVASSVDPDLEKKKWFQYPASWWPIDKMIPNSLRVCNEEILALKQELELLKPRWTEIKADVASIQGTADDLVPLQNQDFILQYTSASQVKVVERVSGMNHFVPWEHPELILKAISHLEEDHN